MQQRLSAYKDEGLTGSLCQAHLSGGIFSSVAANCESFVVTFLVSTCILPTGIAKPMHLLSRHELPKTGACLAGVHFHFFASSG